MENSQNKTNSYASWSLMALLIVLWGSAYALNDIAVKAYSPIWVVAVRLWSGAIALGLVTYFMKLKLPPLNDFKSWAAMAAAGTMGSLLPFFLIAEAQTKVPSALASIYLSATPLFVAIMAHFFIKGEKITRNSFIGVLLGIIGVVILVFPQLEEVGNADFALYAHVFLIIGALCYAATLIIIRLTSVQIDPIALSFGFVLCSAIAVIPFAIGHGAPISPNTGSAPLISMLALGLGPTALASVLYVRMVHQVGPVLVGNISNLVPFWAIFVGVVLFNQPISIYAIIALFVILFGVYLVQKR